MTLGEASREGGAAVAAGGSESPEPHPEHSGNRAQGRPLLSAEPARRKGGGCPAKRCLFPRRPGVSVVLP